MSSVSPHFPLLSQGTLPAADPTQSNFTAMMAAGQRFVYLTDNGNGAYTVKYFYTFRNRNDPTWLLDIQLNGQRIRGPEGNITEQYVVEVGEAPTDGYSSLAYQARTVDVGLNLTDRLVIAGVPAVFTIQARDRFGNLQGSDDAAQDNFVVRLDTDTFGCVYAWAGVNRELGGAVSFHGFLPDKPRD